ncbi:unnamed protein product [Musa acuminata var. zebrina]
MSSFQLSEESPGREIRRDGTHGRGSKRVVAGDEEGDNGEDRDDKSCGQDEPQDQKPGWKKFLAHVGPGFLVSLAYLDPGNLETDLQAGAKHRYELLWVILIGLAFALIIQSLAANLGVATGKHLAELCKAEYPKYVNYCLWVMAEVAVIAADIPEVIGTAFALNILFRIPVSAGVLITGLSTLLLLGLQRYGVRKLELLISMLVFVMAACYFGELSYVNPPATQVMKGLFVPRLGGDGATSDAVALLGALVMPHNLFLHSALVLSRKTPPSAEGINDACRYFLLESGFALSVALLINVAVVSVSGTVCAGRSLPPEDSETCSNLTLNSASFLLKVRPLPPPTRSLPFHVHNLLGKSSSIVYGIALLASGQSSTISGTYAGQYIMQGFLDVKMRMWLQNLMTRCIAIGPSLVVSIIGGPAGAGRLIIITSMILSFELPFALIPLLKFSSRGPKMRLHKNSIYIIVISWILGFGVIGINVYFLSTSFVEWIASSSLPKPATALVGVIVFPFMAVYILAVIYLTFRKDTAVTFVDKSDSSLKEMEDGVHRSDGDKGGDVVPFRGDLNNISPPE